MPLLGLLARAKALRGTPLDPFGRTAQRRRDRQRAADYARTIDALLPTLKAQTLGLAIELAAPPAGVRGFGPVREAAVAKLRPREQELVTTLALAG